MEHLAIFHWFSKYNFVCIPVLAFLLDLIIGDPNSKYHPVAIIGRIISFFEAVLYKDTDNDTKKLWYGGIAVGLILISVYIIVSLLFLILNSRTIYFVVFGMRPYKPYINKLYCKFYHRLPDGIYFLLY